MGCLCIFVKLGFMFGLMGILILMGFVFVGLVIGDIVLMVYNM